MFMASKHRGHRSHHHHDHMPKSHKHKQAGGEPLLDGAHHEWPLRRQLQLMLVTFLYSWSAIATVILLPGIGQKFFSAGQCGDGANSNFCDAAMSKGIGAIGAALALQAFISFLVSSASGVLSDSWGRLPFIVVGLLMQVAQAFALLAYEYGASLYIYLGIRAISGFVEPFPFVLSVVADEAPPAQRAKAFGRQIGCFDVAIIIAPKLFVSIPEIYAIWLLVVSSLLAVLTIVLYGESLPENHRVHPKSKTELLCHAMKAMSILNANSYYRGLAFVAIACATAVSGLQTTYLGWLESAFGIKRSGAAGILTMLGLSAVIVQLIILPVLLKKIGTLKTLVLGLLGMITENTLFVTSSFPSLPGVYMMAAGGLIGSLGTVSLPCVSALTLNAAPEDEHGQVQGAIAATHLLGTALGHLIYAQAYQQFEALEFWGQHWPALTYLITIITCSLSAILVVCCLKKPKLANESVEDTKQ